MKLTFREKYSYGIGAFGKDLVYAFVATYLMMFFTDEVGISSVFVGGLFFVSRFWDAINDPIMGKIVDNTNTKWGKFRPWLLIGTLINAVVLIFLFISAASISICKILAFEAKVFGLPVTRSENLAPIAIRRSHSDTLRLAVLVPCIPSIPTYLSFVPS